MEKLLGFGLITGQVMVNSAILSNGLSMRMTWFLRWKTFGIATAIGTSLFPLLTFPYTSVTSFEPPLAPFTLSSMTAPLGITLLMVNLLCPQWQPLLELLHPTGTGSRNPTLSLTSKRFFGSHAMISFPQRTNSSSATFYLKTFALSTFHLLKPPSTSFGIVHTLQPFGKIPQTPPFLITSSPSTFPIGLSSSHPPHLKLQTTIPYLGTSSPP